MADCNTTEIRNVLIDERYNDIIKGYTDIVL